MLSPYHQTPAARATLAQRAAEIRAGLALADMRAVWPAGLTHLHRVAA